VYYQVFCYNVCSTNSFAERIKKGIPWSSLLPKKIGRTHQQPRFSEKRKTVAFMKAMLTLQLPTIATFAPTLRVYNRLAA
jgi:hypothetical protein